MNQKSRIMKKLLFSVCMTLALTFSYGQSNDYSLSNMRSFSINAQNPWNASSFTNPLGLNYKLFNEDGSSADRYRMIMNYSLWTEEISPNSPTNEMDRTIQVALSYGKETRMGSGRVQGYKGFDVGLYSAGISSKLSSANAWNGVTENGVFGRLFIGADVFIIPQLSLSAEIGYGMSYGAASGGPADVSGTYFGLGNDMISPASGMIMLSYYF